MSRVRLLGGVVVALSLWVSQTRVSAQCAAQQKRTGNPPGTNRTMPTYSQSSSPQGFNAPPQQGRLPQFGQPHVPPALQQQLQQQLLQQQWEWQLQQQIAQQWLQRQFALQQRAQQQRQQQQIQQQQADLVAIQQQMQQFALQQQATQLALQERQLAVLAQPAAPTAPPLAYRGPGQSAPSATTETATQIPVAPSAGVLIGTALAQALQDQPSPPPTNAPGDRSATSSDN